MSAKSARRTKRRTAHKRNKWRVELELANGCLDMVREELVGFGLPMDGCAPMFYNDAIYNIVATLAHAAGLKERADIQKLLGEKFPITGPSRVAAGGEGSTTPGEGGGSV